MEKTLLNNLQLDREGRKQVDLIGSTLQQRYQILEQLGSEGAVTTYLAMDLLVPGNLQLKCAIHRYALADETADSHDPEQAALSAQILYELSRRIDRLPTVYGYFCEQSAFYIVREFIVGCALTQELLPDRPWTESQVVMLLADLLAVLNDIASFGVTPDRLSLSQIVRRTLDRQLVLIDLPMAIGTATQVPAEELTSIHQVLRTVGEIAIIAATGRSTSNLPLSDLDRQQWHSQATKIHFPELIKILDRLIAISPQECYPSITVAWQAVAGVISQLLIHHHHTPADTQATISRHVRVALDRGTEFYEIGDCDRAIAAYEQALALDSHCLAAYCGRGNARRFLGDYAGSLADFKVAVELAPTDGIAYIGRGLAVCFLQPGNNEAIVDFQRGKDLLPQPESAIAYVMRGTASAQLGDSSAAIADYTTAIELNPRLVLAYNNRGNLSQHLGNWEMAVADFTTVLTIDPHSSIAYNNRGIVYANMGMSAAAIADYGRAIELQPNFASAYSNRGNAHTNDGEYAPAIADYGQAIALQPDFAIAYINRANIYRIQGDFAAALADYDFSVSLNPHLAFAYFNRGICHRQAGNHQGAIADYTQAINLDAQYFYAYYHRANARQYLGDRRGAIADYTQTIRFDPDNAAAYYNRAVTRQDLGDYPSAMEDLDVAIQLQPDLPLAHYQRGHLLALNGQHHLALVEYQQEKQLQPDRLETYYQTGISHQVLGNLTDAVTNFNHVLDLDSNYAPAYYQRAKLNIQLGDRRGAITDYHKAANLYLGRGDTKTYQQIVQAIDRLILVRNEE